VSINMLTGYLIFIVTIDNATTKHVYDAVMLGSYAYLQHYSQYNWPDKAIIYVDKAGGSQIGTGTVYSKGIDDYRRDYHTNSSAGQTFIMKVENATRIWTWQLI